MRTFIILLGFALIFSACGSSKPGENDLGNKKLFRYNQTGGLTSLDPAFANKRSNIWATTQLFNGLFSFSSNLDVHPELCREWEVSEDGKIYTFKIKEGVRFHDNKCFVKTNGKGRDVVAGDFVFSFKRVLTTGTGAWIFNDKLLRGPDGNISDTCFVALDDYTLRVYLNRRFPAFLQILAMPYCFVVPKEAVEAYGDDFRANPVGTGPFKFQQWVERDKLLLAKNENYWKKDEDGNPMPYLDLVQITFIEDRNQEFQQFEKGELDFIANLSDASKEKILEKNGEIQEQFSSKYSVEKVPYLNTEYVGFYLGNGEKNPFTNAKVRQALSYAIDRTKLVSYIRNGLGTPGDYGVVPTALPSFDSTKVKGYPFNMRKAQELLKEAGFANGTGLPVLKLYTYTSDRSLAEYLQNSWKEIGVKVEIETNQFATHQEMVDNGKVNFFRGSWLGDYPDAENYLAMFYSKNFAPKGPNKTHFSNPDFDRLFEEAHETDNLFTRYEDYLRMDQIVMNEAPIIVLYYDEVLQLTQPWVIGLKADPMNNLILETVDIKRNGSEVATNK